MELRSWLEDKREQIAFRWGSELRVREDRRGEEGDGVLGPFLGSLCEILSACLGENREAAEEIWQQATHLYGSLALHRGLAAGEVVEEIQLLRSVILKLLFESRPSPWTERGFQRDLLALNQILDRGVAQASVAYVDDLFFSHLQGSGVPEETAADIMDETVRQLEAFRKELGLPPGHAVGRAPDGS